MKFYSEFPIIIFIVSLVNISCEPPSVSVNYLPKKQWKLSKHDLADIKVDIEREMKSKILQLQTDWENKERITEANVYNSVTPQFNNFLPNMCNQFFILAINQPSEISSKVVKNYPRFHQQDLTHENKITILKELIGKTSDKLKSLKKQIEILKNKKINLKNKEKFVEQNKLKNLTKSEFNKKPSKSFSSKNSIINKYASHVAETELNLFEEMFKNYNMTNSNKIDINEVNNKIEQTIENRK